MPVEMGVRLKARVTLLPLHGSKTRASFRGDCRNLESRCKGVAKQY